MWTTDPLVNLDLANELHRERINAAERRRSVATDRRERQSWSVRRSVAAARAAVRRPATVVPCAACA